MGLFGKESKSGKNHWLTGNLDRRISNNRGLEGAMRNLGNKAADEVVKAVVGASDNSEASVVTEYEREERRKQLAMQQEEELLKRKQAYERRVSEKNKGMQLKKQGKQWLGFWISGGKNFRRLFRISLPIVWIMAWGRDVSFTTIFLFLIALSGTIYAGLVIKDSLK